MLEYNIQLAADYLNKTLLMEVIEQNFADPKSLDDWVSRVDGNGAAELRSGLSTAPHPRSAGQFPHRVGSVDSQGAIVKAINLFKMGSSDPFMAVAILRTMLDVDPHHPVPRSMSAVYWRGGDDAVERAIYRPQYFDKIVAWGGGDAINNVIKYLVPGLPVDLVRSEDLDFHDWSRGIRVRRDSG